MVIIYRLRNKSEFIDHLGSSLLLSGQISILIYVKVFESEEPD
jgi:hypothetical protein